MPRKNAHPAARKAADTRKARAARILAERKLPWHEQRRLAAQRAGATLPSHTGATMGLAMAVLGAQALGGMTHHD